MAALDDLAALALDAQLNALGYAVAGRTRRGDDAIELAARLRPDLILLDRRLADRAGFGLIRRLTAQHVAPVIVLGTGEDRRALRQAVAAGAFGYLALPTSLGTLEATIAIAIARAADLANLHDQVGQLGEALAARRVIEQAKGILMQRHNLSERSAYARLRQYARDRRVTMQVVAEAVIEADRQLGT
jgi:response regulator NasT